MQIKQKMLLSYLLIVVLFAAIGTAITLNTIKMSEIQSNVNKQVEIGNYAVAYQKGFTLRSQGLEEVSVDPENAIADTQTGQTLTQATSTYLEENLVEGSQMYAAFEKCNQIDTEIITPAVQKVISAYSAGDSAEIAAQMEIISQAHRQVNANLDDFQLLVVENVQAATAESQSYANFSVMLSAIGISSIAIISVIMALVMSKRITNPLKKLTDIAGKVSLGELNHVIKFTTTAELSEFGEAFQRMINAFKMTTAMSQEEQM
jgi:HAMP domain-containing protein